MTVFMIACGAAVGVLQFFILKNITDRLLISGKSLVFPVILKIFTYAVTAVLLLTILRSQILYIGIGFGGGITSASLIYFVMIKCYDKNSFGKGEK